jgi:group I intron endonuclease
MTFLYKITNTVNNKCYIGWTSKDVQNRWSQHKTDALRIRDNRKFYNAIRKYGIENWIVDTLLETTTVEEAKLKEIELIAVYDSYYKGYNSTKGGDGNNGIVMSKESNQARSLKLKGIKKSPETIEKFKARRSTPEENKKRSLSHKGKKKPWVKWTTEQIEKRAMTRRGLNKEQYDQIHELRQQGLTMKKIGEAVGCSGDMVKKWLKRDWELNLCY